MTVITKTSLKQILISTRVLVVLVATLLVAPFTSSANDNTQPNRHNTWNTLLNNHVVAINNGHSTSVNYAGMQTDHVKLNEYLTSLSAVTPEQFATWQKSEQLAFLINAYNAWTVELILRNIAKDNSLTSIKDIGSFFSSPWSKEFIPLLGETRSLDNIEHTLIRGSVDKKGKPVYNEPRIHFAVNCASIGCPALREEAYTGDQLAMQLEQQTLRFLSDNSRNKLIDKDTLGLSSIFKWYGEDFEKGFHDAYSLGAFIAHYANALKLMPDQQKALTAGEMDIQFLDYNWDLNGEY